MSPSHYKFSLVPRAGILREHGCVPDELADYQARIGSEEDIYHPHSTYWINSPPPETLASEVGAILEPGPSSSEDALMYGSSGGTQIQIWKQREIYVKFDLEGPDFGLLLPLLAFAARHDLLVVSTLLGQPLEPSYEPIVQDIRTTVACAYFEDPREYIKMLAESEDDE